MKLIKSLIFISDNSVSVSTEKSTDTKNENNEEISEENDNPPEELPVENEEKQVNDVANISKLSSLSHKNEDIVTPQENETELSPNLTGTAVKNSAVWSEPSPKFFGSKKRLFPSTAEVALSPIEIVKITR
jgi:hypothetical protein